MVVISDVVLNVLNRIFLVGIAYNGRIPNMYGSIISKIENLDNTVGNVFASAVNNAPFAWKRDNLFVLVVGKYMFSYEKKPLNDGSIGVVVYEVAENGRIVTEQEERINRIVSETINRYLKQKNDNKLMSSH